VQLGAFGRYGMHHVSDNMQQTCCQVGALRVCTHAMTYMMMRGSGTLSFSSLCGKITAPLRYTSSFVLTSSPKIAWFSMRAHCPILEYQPMMAVFTYA
jgi:hypothetical protein